MGDGKLFGTFKPQLKKAQSLDVATGHAQHSTNVHWELPRVKESLVRRISEDYTTISAPKCGRQCAVLYREVFCCGRLVAFGGIKTNKPLPLYLLQKALRNASPVWMGA